MTTPAVSIVIPAYNAERWLPEAIASILGQTRTDWELIVVNDGSTDGTSALAKGYHDPRITVIDQPNTGVSAARNTGIAAAKGDHIAFLDADDAMRPDNLEAKLKLLQESGVDWVYADIALCDEHLRPTGATLVGTDGDVVRITLLNDRPAVPISCSNVVAKRQCFLSGVAFDTDLSNSADQDFTLQLASRFSYRHLPGAFSLYRMLPGSMSKNVERYQADHLRFFRKARRQGFLDNPSFRRTCMANVYWAIGGTWWITAKKPFKALPFFVRAFLLSPRVVIRPVLKRLRPASEDRQGHRPAA